MKSRVSPSWQGLVPVKILFLVSLLDQSSSQFQQFPLCLLSTSELELLSHRDRLDTEQLWMLSLSLKGAENIKARSVSQSSPSCSCKSHVQFCAPVLESEILIQDQPPHTFSLALWASILLGNDGSKVISPHQS